ncbi:MAG: hypothetical protein RL563_2086 [Pseudomonadota bacterium]
MDFFKSKGIQKTSNPWYWEAGHFKHELGSLILAQVFWTTSQSVKLGNPIKPKECRECYCQTARVSSYLSATSHQEFIKLEKFWRSDSECVLLAMANNFLALPIGRTQRNGLTMACQTLIEHHHLLCKHWIATKQYPAMIHKRRFNGIQDQRIAPHIADRHTRFSK